MVKHCCVRGCNSGLLSDRKKRKKNNVRVSSLFKVPKCDIRRNKWELALSQQLSEKQYVCENHFCGEDIIKGNRFVIGGIVTIIPRERWSLKNDKVIPTNHPCSDDISEQIIPISPLSNDDSQIGTSYHQEPSTEVLESDNLEPIQDYSEVIYIVDDPSQPKNKEHSITIEEINVYFSTTLIEGWCYFATKAELIFIHMNYQSRKEDISFSVAVDLSVKVSFMQRPQCPVDMIISTLDDIKAFMNNLQKKKLCQGTGVLHMDFASTCTGEISPHEYKRWQQEPRCMQCRKLRQSLQVTKQNKERNLKKKGKLKQSINSNRKRWRIVMKIK